MAPLIAIQILACLALITTVILFMYLMFRDTVPRNVYIIIAINILLCTIVFSMLLAIPQTHYIYELYP